jgi:hypothetical protein
VDITTQVVDDDAHRTQQQLLRTLPSHRPSRNRINASSTRSSGSTSVSRRRQARHRSAHRRSTAPCPARSAAAAAHRHEVASESTPVQDVGRNSAGACVAIETSSRSDRSRFAAPSMVHSQGQLRAAGASVTPARDPDDACAAASAGPQAASTSWTSWSNVGHRGKSVNIPGATPGAAPAGSNTRAADQLPL